MSFYQELGEVIWFLMCFVSLIYVLSTRHDRSLGNKTEDNQ